MKRYDITKQLIEGLEKDAYEVYGFAMLCAGFLLGVLVTAILLKCKYGGL